MVPQYSCRGLKYSGSKLLLLRKNLATFCTVSMWPDGLSTTLHMSAVENCGIDPWDVCSKTFGAISRSLRGTGYPVRAKPMRRPLSVCFVEVPSYLDREWSGKLSSLAANRFLGRQVRLFADVRV